MPCGIVRLTRPARLVAPRFSLKKRPNKLDAASNAVAKNVAIARQGKHTLRIFADLPFSFFLFVSSIQLKLTESAYHQRRQDAIASRAARLTNSIKALIMNRSFAAEIVGRMTHP